MIVEATLEDDDAAGDGVYIATVALTKAGTYDLQVLLRGLEMPTGVAAVTVEPAVTTSALHSNFTGIAEQYKTGDLIVVTVYARDVYGNLRYASTTDAFQLLLIGQTNSENYGPFSMSTTESNGDGTYTQSMMFTVV